MTVVFSENVTLDSVHLEKIIHFAKKRIITIKSFCSVDVEWRRCLGAPW